MNLMVLSSKALRPSERNVFRRPFPYALLVCFNYNENNQISLDDEVITDIERDKLHREIYRTQGKLASRYELDPLGRLKRQIATLNDLTETGKGKTKVAAGYSQTAVKRSYGYDRTGNLTHSTNQRTGTTKFECNKLGRITKWR